jgi:hypothetical protein
MEKSSEGPKTSDHFLRELIEQVRVYDAKHGVFSESRTEMLETAKEAEAYLNREGDDHG